MQRWMISVRGSRPKIASGSVTDPASFPSRVVIFISMSRALLRRSSRRRRGFGLRRGFRFRLCFSLCFSLGFRLRLGAFADAEFSGLRRFLRQLLLHCIAHRYPAALGAGNRALDKQEAPLDIGLHDLEIERRHPLDTQMTRHLLVLERLARILTAAGASD